LGGAGGAGGGGEVLDGEGGADVVRPNGNGGGGGGGAGCVIVRTDGAAGAIDVNPSVAPGYRALPLLR
ncbi:MAG: hypothetical protein KF901_18300, partial [Myxococcales bacterium]|nr:hypothetical protein [Myxococcales bacterium]